MKTIAGTKIIPKQVIPEIIIPETIANITIYECETCGAQFDKVFECTDCESKHNVTKTIEIGNKTLYWFDSEEQFKKYCKFTRYSYNNWDKPGYYISLDSGDYYKFVSLQSYYYEQMEDLKELAKELKPFRKLLKEK